tara:strand:+ start:5557 stop:5952 length:396 start_codon:yes stop_codon:yes gene_type:complete
MTDIKIETSGDITTITIPVGVKKPVIINEAKPVEQPKPKAIAKSKGKRTYNRMINGMTCEDAILDILIQRDATPKGLVRLTGYCKQTCFAAIHKLRRQGHNIARQERKNGKYRYWGRKSFNERLFGGKHGS